MYLNDLLDYKIIRRQNPTQFVTLLLKVRLHNAIFPTTCLTWLIRKYICYLKRIRTGTPGIDFCNNTLVLPYDTSSMRGFAHVLQHLNF